MGGPKIVKTIHAKAGEYVDIAWHTLEGVYYERHTCPPKATRDERGYGKIIARACVVTFILTNAVFSQGRPDLDVQPKDIESRSRAEVVKFMRSTKHPNGWPGHVVDHVIPLCAGGPDLASNMQWQEVKASYGKDAFERELCRAMDRQGYTMVRK